MEEELAAVLAAEGVVDPEDHRDVVGELQAEQEAHRHTLDVRDNLKQQLAALRAELDSRPLMITAHQVKLLEDRIEFQQQQLASLRTAVGEAVRLFGINNRMRMVLNRQGQTMSTSEGERSLPLPCVQQETAMGKQADRREAGGNAIPGDQDTPKASPSAFHHMLSIKLADLIRECGCRCEGNRDMCDTCEAAVAMEVDGPAVLATEKVVDPELVKDITDGTAWADYQRLEQQLADLKLALQTANLEKDIPAKILDECCEALGIESGRWLENKATDAIRDRQHQLVALQAKVESQENDGKDAEIEHLRGLVEFWKGEHEKR